MLVEAYLFDDDYYGISEPSFYWIFVHSGTDTVSLIRHTRCLHERAMIHYDLKAETSFLC